MKFLFAVFLITLLLMSCVDGSKKPTSTNQNTNEQDTIVKNLVHKFYSWYVYENYVKSNGFSSSPPVKKINDTTYILDGEGYINELKSTRFFSRQFILGEQNKINNCNKEIAKNKWQGDEELDFEGCTFCTYDTWVGGQGEDIDGFNISTIKKQKKDNYIVNVEILINKSKFVTALVTVVLENNEPKIDAIALDFD